MGLKQVETIKSIVLVLLMALSVILTFSIWTYKPKYPMIEQPSTVDISIAEKKDIGSIIKPYKLLFNFEEGLKGTTDSTEIDNVINVLKEWTISDLVLDDHSFKEEDLAANMRKKNRFTLFFHGDVPLSVYNKVLNIEVSKVSEITFNRIIVDWKASGSSIDIHFINKTNNLRYTAKAKAVTAQDFHRLVLAKGRNYEEYAEANPDSTPFIAVPTNPVELIRNTYYQDEKAEINPSRPSRFRDALFTDPNAVRRSQVGANREEFQDDHALMTINTAMKTLNYVQPVAESKDSANPSQLLFDTIDFVNEHGGWTAEFRFTYMNPLSRYVKFQLYVHGLPVVSDTTSAEIEQVWGDDRIYRYMRPYYTLDLTLPSEEEIKILSSGLDVARTLMESEEVDFSTVEEIIPAYFMRHESDRSLFMLEPSWYYLIKDNWIRFSPEHHGGEEIGLE